MLDPGQAVVSLLATSWPVSGRAARWRSIVRPATIDGLGGEETVAGLDEDERLWLVSAELGDGDAVTELSASCIASIVVAGRPPAASALAAIEHLSVGPARLGLLVGGPRHQREAVRRRCRVDAVWPLPDGRPATTRRASSARGSGASAVVGAVATWLTVPPHPPLGVEGSRRQVTDLGSDPVAVRGRRYPPPRHRTGLVS